jgi:putative peptide zinc metalloprotease protein
MSSQFLSDNWYRVAAMKPQIRTHAQVIRQRYRGSAWYVLHDRAANRSWRLSASVWLMLSRLDGRNTVDATWQHIVAELGDDAPSQDEVIQVLASLYTGDMLQTEVAPDIRHLVRRREQQLRSRWLRNMANPMSARFPLWDPDRFLERCLPVVRPLAGRVGLVLWLSLVLPAIFLAAGHWKELTANLSDRLLAFDNLLLLLVIFPLVKLAHELGHAFVVKAGGGEVHEMGVMLLVFAPSPYVDASASLAFRSKWQRALVGASGMLVELALAALALFAWLAIEPGFGRSLAFNVITVAGVSTLIFNGNPLLRYDGYYILSDVLEIPNLGQRANQYYGWLMRRFAFGEREAPPPLASVGERAWFVAYAPAAYVYRIAVAIGIALFIANKYFFVGVVLGIWSIASLVLGPAWKAFRFVVAGNTLMRQRRRALWVSFGAAVLLLVALVLVPFPLSTTADGVVWVPERGEVHAAGNGFVATLRAAPDAQLQAGDAVLELSEPTLLANFTAQQARVRQLEIRATAQVGEDRVEAAVSREMLDHERHALDDQRTRMGELVTSADAAGRFVLAKAEDLPGRYVKRGELLGYVLGPSLRTVRVVVNQDDVGLLREATRAIEVKIMDRPQETFGARLVREVPGARERLPSKALSTEGGGSHIVDTRDPDGLTTLVKVFQFDIELPPDLPGLRFGTRVLVRFRHPPEPLALQAARRIRQLFLSRLHV